MSYLVLHSFLVLHAIVLFLFRFPLPSTFPLFYELSKIRPKVPCSMEQGKSTRAEDLWPKRIPSCPISLLKWIGHMYERRSVSVQNCHPISFFPLSLVSLNPSLLPFSFPPFSFQFLVTQSFLLDFFFSFSGVSFCRLKSLVDKRRTQSFNGDRNNRRSSDTINREVVEVKN